MHSGCKVWFVSYWLYITASPQLTIYIIQILLYLTHHNITMSKTSIAVFGLNGTLGKPTLEALKSAAFADKFQFPVLAVTRDPSKYTSDEYVKYIAGDYIGGKDALVKQLTGVDVIVELLSPEPTLFSAIEAIVAEVKPKVYIPSQFGCDLDDSGKVLPGFLQIKSDHSAALRKSGVKVVDIFTGFFAEGLWLYEIVGHAGIDTEAKTVTYFGSPDSKFAYSSLEDVGRVIASVASKPAGELPDTVRVQSGEVSFAEVAKRYEESHDVKLEAITVSEADVAAEAAKVWAQGFDPSKFLYYLQVVAAAGVDKGASFSKVDRELVNPGESLWKWTKY